MANFLLSMWDNVVSTVTEGVDFALLPMPSPKEPPFDLELSYDDHSAAGGPPPIHPMGSGPRMAVDGFESASEHTDTSPDDECDYDECDFNECGIESDTTTQGAPPPPPPPGPPPPPMVALVDPHVEAKQKISRLVLRLKGVSDCKELKKKTGETESVCLDYDEMDDKGREWADFNARGHKLKDGKEFISLANEKRMEIDEKLEKLADKTTSDGVMMLKDLIKVVEVLGTAGDWYQGGVTDLRESRPLYKELEGVIESMVEFITLRGEMIELPRQHYCEGDEQKLLHKTKTEFEKKDKRWGKIITSGAQSWRENRFPVCERLITSAHDYMCQLVITFVSKSLEGASKGKVDIKKDNPKTGTAKKRLEEAIQLLQTAAPYFTMTHPSICTCDECSKETSEDVTPTQCQPEGLLFELLKQTVKIAEAYLELGIGQFEGYIHKLGKQKIFDHFQSILGLLKKIEDLISSLPRDEVDNCCLEKSMSPIVITDLPESDSLKKTMEKSCKSLCSHVQREATAYKAITSEKDSDTKQEKTKELVHWMSFYCKYSYRMSVAGISFSDSVSKTVQIAFSFIADNLQQYDKFVRVLDRKRIKSHFERIMKVVMSLVANIPINGSSNVDKLLNMLPNSDVLVAAVKSSCDKLLKHYQEHAQNEVNLCQSDEHQPDVIEKRKKEVFKWLAFGGDYLYEMLKALGPDHTDHLLLVFTEFEKVVLRVEKSLK